MICQTRRKGWKAGKNWFNTSKRTKQAKRNLAKLYTGMGVVDRCLWVAQDANSAYGVSGEIYFHMYPARKGDREASEAFWQKVLGSSYPPSYMVNDFVEGVMVAWDEKDEREHRASSEVESSSPIFSSAF